MACAFLVGDYVTFFIFVFWNLKMSIAHWLHTLQIEPAKRNLSRLKRTNEQTKHCINVHFARHPKISYFDKAQTALQNVCQFGPSTVCQTTCKLLNVNLLSLRFFSILSFCFSVHFRWSRVNMKSSRSRLTNVCNFIHRNLSLVLNPMPFSHKFQLNIPVSSNQINCIENLLRHFGDLTHWHFRALEWMSEWAARS